MMIATTICLFLLVFLPIIASFYFHLNKADHFIIWVSCVVAMSTFYGALILPLVMIIFKESCTFTYRQKKVDTEH